jgi:hypothetical protein
MFFRARLLVLLNQLLNVEFSQLCLWKGLAVILTLESKVIWIIFISVTLGVSFIKWSEVVVRPCWYVSFQRIVSYKWWITWHKHLIQRKHFRFFVFPSRGQRWPQCYGEHWISPLSQAMKMENLPGGIYV